MENPATPDMFISATLLRCNKDHLRWRGSKKSVLQLHEIMIFPREVMQVLTIMAVAAPITASVKHNGKGQPHALHRRQLPGLGLGVLASPSPGSTIPTPLSATATISSYAFPTTVVQVPVATVCPDTPATSAIFSILPVSSLISMAGLNGTQEDGRSTTQYLSVHVNATAFLPNGSSTVFLSASSTAVIPAFMSSPATLPNAAIGAETARIVLDKNGCQTIYSEKTTALCTTTVRPAGMLPVPITDCNQWVTFSSQRLDVCSGSPPPSPSNSEAVGGPIEFYLAHWYDLDRGAVPNHVQVQDCVPGSTGLNCVTSSESWDVVTSTTTSTGTVWRLSWE